MRRATWTVGLAAGLAAARCRWGMMNGAARSGHAMQFFSGQFLHRLVARIQAWASPHSRTAGSGAEWPFVARATLTPIVHRDVSAKGVRFYSLCGSCGARLTASATLCEECAQKRQRPARPI